MKLSLAFCHDTIVWWWESVHHIKGLGLGISRENEKKVMKKERVCAFLGYFIDVVLHCHLQHLLIILTKCMAAITIQCHSSSIIMTWSQRVNASLSECRCSWQSKNLTWYKNMKTGNINPARTEWLKPVMIDSLPEVLTSSDEWYRFSASYKGVLNDLQGGLRECTSKTAIRMTFFFRALSCLQGEFWSNLLA